MCLAREPHLSNIIHSLSLRQIGLSENLDLPIGCFEWLGYPSAPKVVS